MSDINDRDLLVNKICDAAGWKHYDFLETFMHIRNLILNLKTDLSVAMMKNEYTEKLLETQGRNHVFPLCLLGELCPWCEIEIQKLEIKDLQTEVLSLDRNEPEAEKPAEATVWVDLAHGSPGSDIHVACNGSITNPVDNIQDAIIVCQKLKIPYNLLIFTMVDGWIRFRGEKDD